MEIINKKSLPLQRGRTGSGKVSLGSNLLEKYGNISAGNNTNLTKTPVTTVNNTNQQKISNIEQNTTQNTNVNNTQIGKQKNKDEKNQANNIGKSVQLQTKSYKKLEEIHKFLIKKLKNIICADCKNKKQSKTPKSSKTIPLPGALGRLQILGEKTKNLYKSGVEKIKNKTINVTNKGLDKIGVNSALDRLKIPKLDAKNNTQEQNNYQVRRVPQRNTPKLSGPSAQKQPIDVQSVKKVPYRPINSGGLSKFAADKAQLLKLGTNFSVIAKIIPVVLKALTAALGKIIVVVVAIVLAVLAVIAAAAIGAMIGALLYENWIKPWQNKELEKTKKSLAPVNAESSMAKEEITTDKGEKVFEREDTKTGDIKYVTESEMKAEMDALSPEQQKEIQEGKGPVSFRQAQNTIDIKSGMYSGRVIKGGTSVEEMNKASDEKDAYDADPKNREKVVERDLARKIVQFDKSFKQRFTELQQAWSEFSEDGATIGVTASLKGKQMFGDALEMLYNEHVGLISQIQSANVSDEVKERLYSISPLFKDSEDSAPDWDNTGDPEYYLPSGKSLDLSALGTTNFDTDEELKLSGRGEAIAQQWSAIDALTKINEQKPAQTEQKQTIENYTGFGTAHYDLEQEREKQKQKEQNKNVQSVPQTSQSQIPTPASVQTIMPASPQQNMSGAALQQTAIDSNKNYAGYGTANYDINAERIKTEERKKIQASQPITPQPPPQAPRRSSSMSGGSSNPPDESGMAAVLTREAARAAGVGGVTG